MLANNIETKSNAKSFVDDVGLSRTISLLKESDKKYHQNGSSRLTDLAYDLLRDEVHDRDPQNAYFKTIGAPATGRHKAELPYYMGSLDKIKSKSATLARFKTEFTGDYLLMDKMDGVSALFVYDVDNNRQKQTERLYTRGDGRTGQDISAIMPNIKGIPKMYGTDKIVVRGELVISKKDFASLHDQGANARNMVAGVVNSNKPNALILEKIVFVAYSVIEPAMKPSEQMKWLYRTGWMPVYHEVINADRLAFDELSLALNGRREVSDYDIDGIVITHDKYYPNVKDRNPSHAFAFKNTISDNVVEVVVSNVEWNISKDGLIKPVVEFDPVHLNGVHIQRATGFNAQYIVENMIGPGARILITRSGDVIPYIIKVVTPASKAMLPTIEYKWNKSKKDIVVIQVDENAQVAVRRLEHFFDRIKVPGFSTSTIQKMYDEGFQDPDSIIFAGLDDFQRIIGTANGAKVHAGMLSIRGNIQCVQLMEASNLFVGFGEKKLRMIVDKVPQVLDGTTIPSVESLVNIKGVSIATANKFIDGLIKYNTYLRNNKRMKCVLPTNLNAKNIVRDVRGDDIERMMTSTKKVRALLTNDVVLFTGFRDKVLEGKIEDLGGRVVSALSKKVTILVYKDDADTKTVKYTQAEEMGTIRIVKLDKFQQILRDSD